MLFEAWKPTPAPKYDTWPTEKGRKLVKGYVTEPVERTGATFLCTRHVAEFEDGTIKITKRYVSVMLPEFNRDSMDWEVIPEKPAWLQWIGNYPADM